MILSAQQAQPVVLWGDQQPICARGLLRAAKQGGHASGPEMTAIHGTGWENAPPGRSLGAFKQTPGKTGS